MRRRWRRSSGGTADPAGPAASLKAPDVNPVASGAQFTSSSAARLAASLPCPLLTPGPSTVGAPQTHAASPASTHGVLRGAAAATGLGGAPRQLVADCRRRRHRSQASRSRCRWWLHAQHGRHTHVAFLHTDRSPCSRAVQTATYALQATRCRPDPTATAPASGSAGSWTAAVREQRQAGCGRHWWRGGQQLRSSQQQPSPSSPRRAHLRVGRGGEEVAAARQQLQAHLQQQSSISRDKAAELAGKLSATLGAAADQQVSAPLQWLVGRGMQPVKAAQLLARMCESGTDASKVRQWPTWQPVFEANWQLADSLLAAYLQQCKETKQRPLKDSESMAALLSSQPSRYRLLRVPDVHSRVAVVQQQLGLTDAAVGQLVAGGLAFGGNEATVAAAIQWLVSFAGSREAAADMLRAAPSLVCISAATLDSKVAALQAAWAGALQPGQVRQLVQRSAMVLFFDEARYQPAADVLRGWFPQFDQLLTAVTVAPHLLGASADILQANERWFLGPPLSLSSQQFLARVRAAPQAFFQNLASANTQHKLAFLTQVGGLLGGWAGCAYMPDIGLMGSMCCPSTTAVRQLCRCVLSSRQSLFWLPGGQRAPGARPVGQPPHLPQVGPDRASGPLFPAGRARRAGATPQGRRHRAELCNQGSATPAALHAAARQRAAIASRR